MKLVPTISRRLASAILVPICFLGTCLVASHMRGDPPRRRPTFHVERISASCNGCAPDRIYLVVGFSTAVDPARVVAAIQSTPAVTLRPRSTVAGSVVIVDGDFQPGARYRFTIPTSLGDGHGMLLERSAWLDVAVGQWDPVALMPVGQALLGPGRLLPVKLEHVAGARIRAVRLAPSELEAAARVTGVHQASFDPVRNLPASLRRRLRERALSPSTSTTPDGVQDVDVFALAGGAPALAILDAPGAAPIATVVQRGELSVLLKVGNASGLAWVTDVRTGTPVSGANVTVYDRAVARFQGRTDANGIVRLPARARLEAPARAAHRPAARRGEHRGDDEDFEGDDEGDGASRPLRAVAEARGEIAFASTAFTSGIERWQFQVPQSYFSGSDSLRGMVSAERGIYRPGEHVHLLGVIRKLIGDGRLAAPSGDVRVRVTDPDGTAMAEQNVRLTEFGTFRLDVPIPRGSRLGRYYVSAAKAGGTVDTSFEVGEYRAASFEVTLPAAGAARRERGQILVPVNARYLYGAPVRAANVTWSASWRARSVAPAGFERFTLAARGSELTFLTQGEVALDRDGNAVIRIPESALPTDEAGTRAQALELVLEASVRDGSNEEITGRTVQSLQREPVVVGIANESWGVDATRGWDFEVVALDASGRAVAGRTIHTTLYRRSWVTTPEDRDDGETGYGGHYEDRAIATGSVRSAAGPVRAHFDMPGGGEYRVEASLSADGGRTSAEVWAWGSGESYGPVRDEPRITLRPERESFAPGDLARVHVESPWASATALVTTERAGVIDARVTQLRGASTPVEVTIASRHLPNVIVGVAVVPNGLGTESPVAGVPLRLGYANLAVSAEERRLRVEVRPEHEDARPGDSARVRVAVKDARGRPVRAEVTLWAADEGVLQLTGYRTPDPFEPAYSAMGLGVESASNLTRWTTRVPSSWDEGGIGDAGGAAAGALRSRFLSTAFFSEGVVTGRDGTAVVTVPLPDNLTRWRVMAAVADAGESFGSAQASIRTSKPLQVMAALPRFLTLGDRVELGAVVHNETETAGPVDVRFEVLGADVTGSASQRITMERGAQMPVHVTAVARSLGEITVRVRVSKGTERDGIEVKIPVQAPSLWARRLVGDGLVDGQASTTITTPADMAPGLGEVRITLASSVVASLASGLDALVEYPNGCVEQTTSTLIPMVLLEDLVKADPHFATAEHRTRMNQAIDHVYEHQNDDGGFGLWPASDSEGFLTAYALWGLLTSRDHGYEVSRARIDRGLAYLRQHATEGDDMHGQFAAAETNPFAAYVLAYAQEQDGGLGQRLTGRTRDMSRFGVGLLTTAVARRRGETEELVRTLSAARAPAARGGAVVREAAGGQGDLLLHGRDLRATSVAVQALTVLGKTREASDLVSGILAARESDGTWGSTYNNLWALYGISAFADATERRDQVVQVSVRLGGRDVGRARIDGRSRVTEITIPASALPAPGQSAALEIRAPGSRNIRYSAVMRWVVDLAHQRATDNGLRVERELRDADTGAVVTSPRIGQIVRVRLKIVARTAQRQIALTDRLPAGFEPIDTSLATERQRVESGGHDWTWIWREMHDERVAFFADDLSAGEHTAEYLARVTRSGTFSRPAASAEAMYDPGVWGTGAVETITVR